MTLIPFPERPAQSRNIVSFFNRDGERRDGPSTATRSDSSMRRWHAGEPRFMTRERHSARSPILLISGGDAHLPDSVILRSFLDLAGRKSARILILSTADPGTGPANAYAKLFSRYGAGVELAQVSAREQAEAPDLSARLREQTALLITGMTREQFTQIVDGTLLANAIRAASARGLVVAGAGSAASVLGQQMLPDGLHIASPLKGVSDTGVPGLGLIDHVSVDHHARVRDRIGHVMAMVAERPGLTVFGIEDDTALIITPERTARVIGKNSVIVIDGQGTWSDCQQRAEGEVITVTGCTFHTLAPGCAFDLEQRRVRHLQQIPHGRPVG